MKKELFAALLLVLILVLSLMNSSKLTKLTDEISGIIESCDKLAYAGEWEEAAASAETAIKTWESNDSYTHVVLHHTDIDSMTNDLYELLEHVYTKDAGAVSGISELVRTHLNSISSMEKIRLGSIF